MSAHSGEWNDEDTNSQEIQKEVQEILKKTGIEELINRAEKALKRMKAEKNFDEIWACSTEISHCYIEFFRELPSILNQVQKRELFDLLFGFCMKIFNGIAEEASTRLEEISKELRPELRKVVLFRARRLRLTPVMMQRELR